MFASFLVEVAQQRSPLGRDHQTAQQMDYAGKKVRKASRPSVLQKLAVFKTMVRDSAEKVKKKVLER